jgi:hypothetical protein
MNDFDARGLLAARFSCWHRLTGPESDELVDFFVELEARVVEQTMAVEAIRPELDKLIAAKAKPVQPVQRKPLTIEEAMDLLPTNTSMSRTDLLLWVLRATERAHGITDPLDDGGKVMGGGAS